MAEHRKSSFLSTFIWVAVSTFITAFAVSAGVSMARRFLFAKPMTIGRGIKLMFYGASFLIVALLIIWAAFWGASKSYTSSFDFMVLDVPAIEDPLPLPEIKDITVDQLTLKHALRNLLAVISWQVIFLLGLSIVLLLLPAVNFGSIFFGGTMTGLSTFLFTLVAILLSPFMYLFGLFYIMGNLMAHIIQLATPAYWIFMVVVGLPIVIFVQYYGSLLFLFFMGLGYLYLFSPLAFYRWLIGKFRRRKRTSGQPI